VIFMKKMLFATAVAMTFGTTAAFAHHPAAEIVDPEIYAMIDENVSDTHAELTLDDMGSDATASMGMSAQDAAADVVADVEEVQARGAMGPQR
jgi:hypothetical protein